MSRILLIPDLHVPYHHKKAISFLTRLKHRFKPDTVICIGDEADAHSVSRYVSDPDLSGPGDELIRARAALKPLFKLFPVVKACKSNHTYRWYKRAQEARLPFACVRSITEILDAPPGWVWQENWQVDGILFCHGEGFSGENVARKLATKHRCSVVAGHVHTEAGVCYLSSIADTIFGASTGCLIDIESRAFAYAANAAKRPVLGTVIIDEGVPNFVPLEG